MNPLPHVDWFIAVEGIEQKSDKIDLLGVFGGIFASEFPVTVANVHFVAKVSGGAPGSTHNYVVAKRDRITGNILRTRPMPLTHNHHGVGLAIIVMPPITVTTPGMYRFDLEADGQIIGHLELPFDLLSGTH